MRAKIIIILFLVVFVGVCVSATPVWMRLTMPRSAVDHALGGAFPTQLNNPAFLCDAKLSARASYMIRFGGETENNLFASYRTGNLGFFSNLGINSVSDIEARTHATEKPDYIFAARRFDFTLGASAYVGKSIRVGASVKYVYEKVEFFRAEGVLWTLGALAERDRLWFGATLENVGKKIKMKEFYYSPPQILRSFIGYKLGFAAVGLSYCYLPEAPDFAALGAKFSPLEQLRLYGSFVFPHDSRSFALGMSFLWRDFSVNYSIASMKNLGVAHNFGISYSYDRKISSNK